jgi:hypothetical protein
VDSSPAAEKSDETTWLSDDEPAAAAQSAPPRTLADIMDEDDDVGPHAVFPDSAYWESAVDEVLSPVGAFRALWTLPCRALTESRAFSPLRRKLRLQRRSGYGSCRPAKRPPSA